MRLLPKGSIIYPERRKPVDKSVSYVEQSERISRTEEPVHRSEDSEEEESTSVGGPQANDFDIEGVRNEAIKSQAYINSIFHPDYK